MPPQPSINEVEQRQQPQEQPSRPELLRTVKYLTGDELWQQSA